MMKSVIAIDQGTTGTKSFRLSEDGRFEHLFSIEHRQIYPHPGWVEHDPLELAANVQRAAAVGLSKGPAAGIGLDNQGETVMAWHGETKEPIYNAIVWQDRRTTEFIEKLKSDDAESLSLERAGLPLDPYFSASKLHWIIESVPPARRLLNKGLLRLGTSEVFFFDRLTGVYATDATTASRTGLMNIKTLAWDPDLCELFGVPAEILPEIRSTTDTFGTMKTESGESPITAAAVDQQAALFGHRCFEEGEAKITFGTGAFAMVNTGKSIIRDADAGISATVAWRLKGLDPVYAVDGAIYNAASAVNWLRRVGLISGIEELDALGPPPACEKGLFFVPALSGLACPHWDRRAAGMWIGIDLETEREDLVKAVLEGVAFRTAEMVEALSGRAGSGHRVSVDGGLANNMYFCDLLAQSLGREVLVPDSVEITALGAAFLAMLGAGLGDRPAALPRVTHYRRRHQPGRDVEYCLKRFRSAVSRAKAWRKPDDAGL